MQIDDIYQQENGNNIFICKLTEDEVEYIIKHNFDYSSEFYRQFNELKYSFVVDPTGHLWETFMLGNYRIDNFQLPESVVKVIYRYKKLKRICQDED